MSETTEQSETEVAPNKIPTTRAEYRAFVFERMCDQEKPMKDLILAMELAVDYLQNGTIPAVAKNDIKLVKK